MYYYYKLHLPQRYHPRKKGINSRQILPGKKMLNHTQFGFFAPEMLENTHLVQWIIGFELHICKPIQKLRWILSFKKEDITHCLSKETYSEMIQYKTVAWRVLDILVDVLHILVTLPLFNLVFMLSSSLILKRRLSVIDDCLTKVHCYCITTQDCPLSHFYLKAQYV